MPEPIRVALTEEERETLTSWSRASAGEHRLVERSRIILLAADGLSAREIARRVGTRLARVSKWRQRFTRDRLAGLRDAPRPGKPQVYGEPTGCDAAAWLSVQIFCSGPAVVPPQ